MDTNKNKISEGIWKLEKYGKWEGNGWTEVVVQSGNLLLILKNMQLMVVRNETLVESISLFSDFQRVAYKDGSLGIGIQQKGSMRKIRVKFAGSGIHSGTTMGKQCVKVLKNYIKICDFTAGTPENESNVITLQQYISDIMNKDVTSFVCDHEMNSKFPVEDAVLSCILDPQFPSFIAYVNSVLQKLQKGS